MSILTLVSKEKYKQRILICKDCDKIKKKTMQCSVCNCFMLIKAYCDEVSEIKIYCPHPEGSKWEKYEIISQNNGSQCDT